MKGNYIVTYIALLLIGIQTIMIPVGFLTYESEPVIEQPVSVNWETMYPFDESATNSADVSSGWGDSMLNQYDIFCNKIITKFERGAGNHLFFDDRVSEIYGVFCDLIGLKIFQDTEATTVVLSSGELIFLTEHNYYINNNIEDVIMLNDYVHEAGMEFVYVQAPRKEIGAVDIIPGVVENVLVDEKDKICTELRENNVDVFEVKDYLPQKYEDYMSCFYKTDHHWRPQTGIYITASFAEHVNEEYGYNIDYSVYQDDNFNIITWENKFLGSQGKKLPVAYVETENFEFLEPKEMQNWTVNIPTVGLNETGDFDLVINENALNERELYSWNPYASYIYGDQAYVNIVNNNIDKGPSVLVIGDSYAEVFVPFLAMSCPTVDRIDLRYFNGSLKTFLRENEYDIIVLLESRAGEEYDMESHNSSWDFR